MMTDKQKLDIFLLVGALVMIVFFVWAFFVLNDATKLYNEAWNLCYSQPTGRINFTTLVN